mgnify:CR=1 FL=1
MNELTFRPITAADETDFYTMQRNFTIPTPSCTPSRQNITAVPLRK